MVEIAVDRHFHRLLLRHPDQRASRLVGDDAAIIDDGDAIAQLPGLLQIMGGEHDGNALGIEAPDIVTEPVAKLDIDAGRRLVQDGKSEVKGTSGSVMLTRGGRSISNNKK